MTRLQSAAALAAVVAVVLSGTAGGAQRPLVKTESAHLRAWTVTLTYGLAQRGGGIWKVLGLHLTASAHGIRRIDRMLPLPECGDFGCVSFGGPASVLELADLGDGQPTAVLWLWTGGAHCCSIAETVSLSSGVVAQHDFGNHGASIARVGNARLFTSVDDRFSYLYTSYAASGNPLQLWRLTNGRFIDVTASYPGLVSRDAVHLWELVVKYRRREEIRGLFAAWAADACRLSGWARVSAAARPLIASGAFSPPQTDPFGPTGARFPVILRRDLTRFGNCRKP